ncbi:uncharacterized protein UTRI_03510 [Ustilago trichophora]|uniref:Uncharacterized protein n=1 Tax=Ustilago trichophora TaxID=86804 RepID=A0A5C3E1F5_9BASI|nr:uncharacterized protein UTRI_03510 [Ustilago trichophora]
MCVCVCVCVCVWWMSVPRGARLHLLKEIFDRVADAKQFEGIGPRVSSRVVIAAAAAAAAARFRRRQAIGPGRVKRSCPQNEGSSKSAVFELVHLPQIEENRR